MKRILKYQSPRRRPMCRKSGQAKVPWPGTNETVCGCTQIAPIARLMLPFSLPILPPSARWPGVDDHPAA
jgi:hypothetical protein